MTLLTLIPVLAALAGSIPAPAAALDTPVAPDSLVAPGAFAARDSLPQAARLGGRAGRDAAADSAAAPVEFLWVLRGSLATRASIDSVVARAVRMHVRGLLVQAVGRGDACYRSDILPPAEFLAQPPGPDFDPFGTLVERARAEGLEVHAWVNCLLVWSSPRAPRDLRHVVNAHPEWIERLRDGRAMTRMSPDELKRRGVEGVFLSAAHPQVREWIAGIAREIATRYPVSGIHLDYIRHPSVEVGWAPTSRARFALEAGVDPARLGGLAASQRAAATAAWNEFQRDQVTAIVRAVRDSLQAVRPGIALSAAVIADTVRAERSNAQMWRAWIKEGLIDRAFLMCYAVPVQTVVQQLVAFAGEFGHDGRLVPGIAMYNSRPATAALKIKGARALGFPQVALYSYDSLFEYHNYWNALRTQLAGAQGTP